MHHKSKHQRLGYWVLIYAFVTSGALLTLFSGRPDTVNGLLWTLYVAGGIGLVRSRQWGRTLTMIATGGSIVALFFLRIELAYGATVWPLAGIPALLLFAGAWRLKEPQESTHDGPPPLPEHKAGNRRWTLHNMAYKCYIFMGSVSLWTSVWAFKDPDPGVIGFLVMIPFGLPLLLASVTSLATSLYLWRDSRLLILFALTLATFAIVQNNDIGKWPKFLIPYGAVAIVLGILWFRKYRDRWYASPAGLD